MSAKRNNHIKNQLTPTWFEHATFWSGVRRATVAPRSPYLLSGNLCTYDNMYIFSASRFILLVLRYGEGTNVKTRHSPSFHLRDIACWVAKLNSVFMLLQELEHENIEYSFRQVEIKPTTVQSYDMALRKGTHNHCIKSIFFTKLCRIYIHI